jgi:hypothetical protein
VRRHHNGKPIRARKLCRNSHNDGQSGLRRQPSRLPRGSVPRRSKGDGKSGADVRMSLHPRF